MAGLKKQFERAVGDAFVTWYNRQLGSNFALARQGENPDLVYLDGQDELNVEVTSAYYDDAHARSLWQHARSDPNAPQGQGALDFDSGLVEDVNQRLAEKCLSDYGSGCVLLVRVSPRLTGADDMESLLGKIVVPKTHPFVGIYLVGDFGSTSTDKGGYRCWRLDKP